MSKMSWDILYNNMLSTLNVFLQESLDILLMKMSLDIVYNDMASLLSEFVRLPGPGNIVGHFLLEYGDFSCYKLQKMSLDILYKNMAPLLNEFFGDFTSYLLMKMS